ncbi:unnamed protein product [Cladocopium goreaui]|uniref:Pentatricopeptide repeat-containing protein At1g74850, chloroplastic (Protein PLASTID TRANSCRIPTIONALLY ACTIVE 2) n=1 Tax=Cladocopium goreaui TaxID=2562237 RepID=A0A9P1BNY1_9DINO|nr:unnamed protein product [Cladocopium goreaui]
MFAWRLPRRFFGSSPLGSGERLILGRSPSRDELLKIFHTEPVSRRGPREHLHQRLQKLANAKREDLILPVLKLLLEQKVKLDPRDFSVGISGCARAALWQDASVLFATMHAGKVYPNVFVYNATISAYEKSGHWQHALRLFQLMTFTQVFPTVVSYNSMISACEKGGEWERALIFFRSVWIATLSPTLVTYSATISALEKCGFWQGALSLLAQMLAGRVTPDVTSYNALISACEKGGEWQRALHLFQLCRSELQPNLVSYNAMISACQKGWQWQQALKIFNSIPEAKLRPNLVTYSAVISSLEKSRALWQLALHFFQQLKVSWSPDVISYNASISCCGAAGEWQPALSLLRNMVDSSISPTVVTYTSTIHSFTATAEWQRALVLWQQMHQASLASNFTAVSSMLDVLGGSTSKSAESVATAMFEAALRAKIFEDLVSAGPQKLDLHGYSVGASQLAVRWWLQMTVAPYLASERWKIGHEGEWTSRNLPITLVTGFGSSLATYSPKLRPALLELLRGMGLAAEMNRSNPGRIEVELERLRRFGFHVAEVQRAKRAMLAEFEEDYIEREQRPSESFAEEFTALFLDEDCAPGVEERARIAAQILPQIRCEEVSSIAKLYDFTKNVVVKIATPLMSLRSPAYTCWSVLQACRQVSLPRPSLDLPSEEEVAQIMKDITAETMEAWPPDQDDVDGRLKRLFEGCAEQLLPAGGETAHKPREVRAQGVPKPTRASEVAVEVDEKLGEEVILQNGLRIFFKETDLYNDEILVKGRRWGGLSEFQDPRVGGLGNV